MNDEKPESHLELRFTRVYAGNLWEDAESISGPGSRLGTAVVNDTIAALDEICATYNVRTLVDVPCGDLNWMSVFLADKKHISYHGFDIVKPLIERNHSVYPGIKCDLLDITSEVPPAADLVLCKDLIIHLEYDDIDKLIANVKASGSRYLLATNNFGLGNIDLLEHIHGDSACRYVDLNAPPFMYGPPIWRTDFLGLWELANL